MPIRFTRTVPIFRIFSEEKAKEFYLGFLGFHRDWEHWFDPDAPVYMQVSRAGMILHLSEHHGDGAPGATLFVETAGLDALHAEGAAKNYRYLRPGIEDAPWGARVMTVADSFSNRIRFSEKNRPDRPANPPRPALSSGLLAAPGGRSGCSCARSSREGGSR